MVPNATDRLRDFPVAALCNAHRGVQAFEHSVRPAYAGARIFGRAKTAVTEPGQNAAIHRAVHTAMPGDILVVSTHRDLNCGYFGDLLASASLARGISGLAIDGAIRDVKEIAELRFPVFCSGTNPTASGKKELGMIDVEVSCGGTRVRPGDLISGDQDGVVVVPRDLIEDVAKGAEEVIQREASIRAQLASGKTTCEIFGIPVWPGNAPKPGEKNEQRSVLL